MSPRRPRVSLRVIKHLRQEGLSRPSLADGPIAALEVYAQSEDTEVAEAAREAIAALAPSEPREEKT